MDRCRNNVHSNYDPEKRIVELANESVGITELATKLLNESYELGTGQSGVGRQKIKEFDD